MPHPEGPWFKAAWALSTFGPDFENWKSHLLFCLRVVSNIHFGKEYLPGLWTLSFMLFRVLPSCFPPSPDINLRTRQTRSPSWPYWQPALGRPPRAVQDWGWVHGHTNLEIASPATAHHIQNWLVVGIKMSYFGQCNFRSCHSGIKQRRDWGCGI